MVWNRLRNAVIRAPARGIRIHPLQAQPSPTVQFLSASMQVSPQALPFSQILQQPLAVSHPVLSPPPRAGSVTKTISTQSLRMGFRVSVSMSCSLVVKQVLHRHPPGSVIRFFALALIPRCPLAKSDPAHPRFASCVAELNQDQPAKICHLSSERDQCR